MDLLWVILFQVMYYIRPQEWFSFFASIRFASIVMIGAIFSLFFRGRGVQPGQILRTPHDWMILLFFAWVVFASPTPYDTFKEIYSLPITYFIVVLTLSTIPRMKRFLGWWTFLIVAIAALALASEYGFDPLGSNDLTHGRMKDRLTLNLSIFRNPNALGHNVVPAIPMLYYFCVWRRPLFMKEIGYACLVLPLYCIYLTQSKGSFITGAATVVATFTFGRPKTVQALIIAIAIAGGTTVLYALPRMNELQKVKSDDAIKGRVAAFTHGLKRLEERTFGIGYKRWLKDFYAVHHFNKAAHSSYVQIGAELGYTGFLLFLGILYCNLRTLITAKTVNDDEERIRRILFILAVSYMLSSWMLDLGYRPTFFMFTAAIAAFHRHLHGVTVGEDELEAIEGEPAPVPLALWRARLLPQPAMEQAFARTGMNTTVMALEASGESVPAAPDAHPISRIGWGWNRLGLIDLAFMIAITMAAVKFWHVMLTRM